MNALQIDTEMKTDYPTVQCRFMQRKTGPPPDWTGPPPPRGCEVFVGKLPRRVNEEELMPLFLSVGKVFTMRLMLYKSGANRGFAFIVYATRAEASAAVEKLNGYEIRPRRQIVVLKTSQNWALFIDLIPISRTKEELYQELSKRVAGVVEVLMYTDTRDELFGYALVAFESYSAEEKARRELVPGRVELWGQEVAVHWAGTGPDIEAVKQIKEKSRAKDEGDGDDLDETSPRYAPTKLEVLCKKSSWALPYYAYQRFAGLGPTNRWACVAALQVGAPLYEEPRRLLNLGKGRYLEESTIDAAVTAIVSLMNLDSDSLLPRVPEIEPY